MQLYLGQKGGIRQHAGARDGERLDDRQRRPVRLLRASRVGKELRVVPAIGHGRYSKHRMQRWELWDPTKGKGAVDQNALQSSCQWR